MVKFYNQEHFMIEQSFYGFYQIITSGQRTSITPIKWKDIENIDFNDLGWTTFDYYDNTYIMAKYDNFIYKNHLYIYMDWGHVVKFKIAITTDIKKDISDLEKENLLLKQHILEVRKYMFELSKIYESLDKTNL
jgi:hypothetical protein